MNHRVKACVLCGGEHEDFAVCALPTGWWRIKVKRNDQGGLVGFATGCGSAEFRALISQAGVEVLADPYNPAGYAGSLRDIPDEDQLK